MKIDFIIPSYNSEELTSTAIKSFEAYKSHFDFRYIVVENAANNSYKHAILSLADDVVWVPNSCRYSSFNGNNGSYANAEAIEVAAEYVKSDYVFICHNDVVACHENWMTFLFEKIQNGNDLVGVREDKGRINALHSSGILMSRVVFDNTSPWPVKNESGVVIEDVCDSYTKYCRQNNLNYFCVKNTFNDSNLKSVLKGPYRNLKSDMALDDEDNVIFMHIGRGAIRENNEWKSFVKSNVLLEKAE